MLACIKMFSCIFFFPITYELHMKMWDKFWIWSLFPSSSTAPSCSSLSPCCGKASLASSGLESTGVHDRLPGRWSATPWHIWSVRQRTSTGLAGPTWPKSKSWATLQSGEHRTGSISKQQTLPSSLNTSTSRITWVTSESPRHGEVNVTQDTQRLTL